MAIYDYDGRKIGRNLSPKNKEEYNRYLKTPYWQRRRKEILRRDEYMCVGCSSKKNLQVHHMTYSNLGRESDRDLVTLCKECHENQHCLDLNKDKKEELIKEATKKLMEEKAKRRL